jgi:hypothetical protein
MKRISLLLALAVALVGFSGAPAYADASQNGCEHSDYRAAGCTQDPVGVPEPGSFALLAVGLVTLGGLAVAFGRKRSTQN